MRHRGPRMMIDHLQPHQTHYPAYSFADNITVAPGLTRWFAACRPTDLCVQLPHLAVSHRLLCLQAPRKRCVQPDHGAKYSLLPPHRLLGNCVSQAAARQRDGRCWTAGGNLVGANAAASATRTCTSLKWRQTIDMPAWPRRAL